MKRCKEHRNELAACAALQQEPGKEVAAHLAECAGCHEMFAELWRASEYQARAAAEMAAPRLRARAFSFARLRKGGSRPRMRCAAGLCGLAACALILGVGLVWRDHLPQEEDVPMVVSEKQVIIGPQEIEPTWGALRKQIEENREIAIASAGTGSSLRHLQLKDAYGEWE